MTMRIYLDPGHDLSRPGCAHNGIDERQYVYDLAVYLDAYLRMGPMCSTIISRERNTANKSHAERAQEARTWGADVAVCLHVNAMADGQPGRGLIAFADGADPSALDAAEAIARCAPRRLLRQTNRTIATERGGWLRNAHAVLSPYAELGVPAVLVELGFATDAEDARTLKDNSIRPAIVAMLLAGVARIYERNHG